MGCVYCVTNKVNGKKYVGKTIGELDARRKKHESDSKLKSHLILHRALRKYGFENFEWDILFVNSNDAILVSEEMDHIKYLGTKKPNGYNLTDGGEGLAGHTHSEETKKKIGKGNKGKNLGKIHTPEANRSKADFIRGKTMEEVYGKERAEEINKKRKAPIKKKRLEDGRKAKEFSSMGLTRFEIAEKMNVNPVTIWRYLKRGVVL